MLTTLEVFRRQREEVCSCCGWHMIGGMGSPYWCHNFDCFSYNKNGNAKRLRQRNKIDPVAWPVPRR